MSVIVCLLGSGKTLKIFSAITLKCFWSGFIAGIQVEIKVLQEMVVEETAENMAGPTGS